VWPSTLDHWNCEKVGFLYCLFIRWGSILATAIVLWSHNGRAVVFFYTPHSSNHDFSHSLTLAKPNPSDHLKFSRSCRSLAKKICFSFKIGTFWTQTSFLFSNHDGLPYPSLQGTRNLLNQPIYMLHKISHFPFHTSDNIFVMIKTYSNLFHSCFCIMIFFSLFFLYRKNLRISASAPQALYHIRYGKTHRYLAGVFFLANKRRHLESNNLFISHNFICLIFLFVIAFKLTWFCQPWPQQK